MALRLDFSPYLSKAIAYTPAFQEYAYGQTLLDVIEALIPRVILPTKRYRAGDSAFVARYTGLEFQNVSVGAGYVFEFYINFGLLGVMVGMICLGLLMAKMECTFYAVSPAFLWRLWTLPAIMFLIAVNINPIAELVVTATALYIVCRLVYFLPIFHRLEQELRLILRTPIV